jgi:hypothetical protein
MHLRKFEVFSFNQWYQSIIHCAGAPNCLGVNGKMYDGGFIKRGKNQDEKIGFSIQTGPGGINRVSDSVKKILRWRERARFQSLALRGDFPAMAFLVFRACRVFWGRIFCCACRFSDCNFRRDFRVCILFVDFFLQQRFSAFPSARFQHVSFSKVPACFLPARFCVCVCWFCDVRGDFLGQHFQLISFEQGFFNFVWFCDFRGAFGGPAFPAYFLQHFPQLVFQ